MPKARPIPAPVTRPAPIARARAGDPYPAGSPPRLLRIFELPIESGTRRGAVVLRARRAAAKILTRLRRAPLPDTDRRTGA